MNWRLSKLDRFRLVSNSDAHSPGKLGREACVFECAMDYFAMLRTLQGPARATAAHRVFPEEGQVPSRRSPQVRNSSGPRRNARKSGICPECGKPVTVGVMKPGDGTGRPARGRAAKGRGRVHESDSLNEVIGETIGVGPQSKSVMNLRRPDRQARPELHVLGELRSRTSDATAARPSRKPCRGCGGPGDP